MSALKWHLGIFHHMTLKVTRGPKVAESRSCQKFGAFHTFCQMSMAKFDNLGIFRSNNVLNIHKQRLEKQCLHWTKKSDYIGYVICHEYFVKFEISSICHCFFTNIDSLQEWRYILSKRCSFSISWCFSAGFFFFRCAWFCYWSCFTQF